MSMLLIGQDGIVVVKRAYRPIIRFYSVNRAEIDDIDPDLWIHDLPQYIADPRRFPRGPITHPPDKSSTNCATAYPIALTRTLRPAVGWCLCATSNKVDFRRPVPRDTNRRR